MANKQTITDLTDEQKALMPVIKDEWVARGTNCDPIWLEKAIHAVRRAYIAADSEPPQYFLVADGPLMASLMHQMLVQLTEMSYGKHRKPQDGLTDKKYRFTEDFLKTSWESMCKQIPWRDMRPDGMPKLTRSQAFSRFDRQAISDGIRNSVNDFLYGYQEYWLSYYEFFLRACTIEHARPLEGLIDLSKCCGWWAAYAEVAILQHRPLHIRHTPEYRLHCDGGPAVAYRDGHQAWFLNNVKTSHWLSETRSEDLRGEDIAAITNAQERAEGIRKMGLDRYVYHLGAKVIESEGEYDLLAVRWHDGTTKKMLKMKNPSVPELWHVEGVDNSCETIDDAMAFRVPERFQHLLPFGPNGSDWFQQGDQYFVPEGATSLKPRPCVMT